MRKMNMIALLLILCLISSCGEAPRVAQGKVVAYESETKILTLKSDTPATPELTFSLQSADYGVEPSIGDSVRLAYREEAGKRIVLRVMNLSKPSEVKKKGH